MHSWGWLFVFFSNSFLMVIILQLFLKSQELHSKRQRLNEALDNLKTGIMLTDEEDDIIFSNTFYHQHIHPLIQDEIKGNSLKDTESLLCVFNNLILELQKNESYDASCVFEKYGIKITASNLKRYKKCTLWIFEKITQPKYTFKPGFISEQDGNFEYDIVFHESPTGIAILGNENQLIKANRAFGAISGLPEKNLLHKSLDDLLTKESLAKLKLHFEATMHNLYAPIDILLKDAPDKSINLYYSNIIKDGDELKRIIHFIDSSEQKKLEAQFVQSQKMQAIGQLAGGIAHDFNNLLTAMIGFCDLLLLRHIPGDQSFSDIMHIKQNANRAATLVRQLLAFSRQQTLQSKVINVNDAIADLCVLMRRLLGVSVELKVVYSSEIGTIKADLGQIEQVLVNLSVNARDAMPSGGILTIKTFPYQVVKPLEMDNEIISPGPYVCIEISDTGMGISKEHLSRIFEPFFSTKPVGKGTGLGLSTVYGIIKQTGGFIRVDSHINQGSIFKIYLPQYQEANKPTIVSHEENDKPSGDLSGFASILLVEDEESVRMFGARALRDKGYRVFEAACGDEALEFITNTQEKIDLIITDVVMPRVDGPTLVNELKKRHLNFKVIFISGYMEDSFRQQLNSEEDIHFLLKPFNLRDFALKVKSVLDEKKVG